jgi:hypothetical protein
MNKFIFLLFSIFFVSLTKAQTTSNTKESFALFNFGRSFNGTGDISGFHYGISYAQYIKNKKIYWQLAFEGTLHDDETINFFDDGQANSFEGKSRFVTGGFQFVSAFGYHFIKNNRNNFGLSIGPLLRYQSSSIPNEISIYYPPITGLPFPVESNVFTDPFRTIALGGTFRLNYDYKFKNHFLIGFTGAFQTDTNGDAISSVMLCLGKAF